MSGIWIDKEGSPFYPAGSKVGARHDCLFDEPDRSILPLDRDDASFGKAYEIVFIGAQTSELGDYCFGRGPNRELLAHRIISIREVPKPETGTIIGGSR
jgi:hypothetical protein